MKIELEVPDWVEDERRAIYILAGIENVAYKMPWENFWHVKVSRCSMCGKCCMRIQCPELKKEPGNDGKWKCGKDAMRPHLCCTGESSDLIPECTSRYKEVSL